MKSFAGAHERDRIMISGAKRRGRSALARAALLAAGVAGSLAAPGRADALVDDGDGPNGPGEPQIPICLQNATGSLSANPASIVAGQSVTVSWSAQYASGCPITLRLSGQTVAKNGSKVVQPTANATYTLTASTSGVTRTLATASVAVGLPQQGGRPVVVIDSNGQAQLFVNAIGADNAVVYVQNHVQLDLSHREGLRIAPGVSIIGGRSPSQPGPRIFTTTRPHSLFVADGDGTRGDNVRITGLRIEGADLGVADSDTDGSTAIRVLGRSNVKIDNNEIYGWRGSGVEVSDDAGRIALGSNAQTVRVVDNYIHHNQHQGRLGYGVVVSNGAYALIERNVFDWNRHAIAGDGSDGSGYHAYRNLLLEHGGFHRWLFGFWAHTHQFDMHGQESCNPFSDTTYDCGTAGEYMDLRHNSSFYTEDDTFKLRGTPTIRADVAENVFASSDPWSQNETGLQAWSNLYGVNESGQYGQCDFDADGVSDRFFATGRTWWFSSGGVGPWTYLNTSSRRLSDVTLGDVDGDGRCDVTSYGVVSSRGRGASARLGADILWRHDNGALAVWKMNGGTIEAQTYPPAVDGTWQVQGSGDFNGDGQSDILWRNVNGQVAIWHMVNGAKVGEAYPGGQDPSLFWKVQAVGDFDGDGASDILWRDGNGVLAIWFKGNPDDFLYPAASPSYANAGGVVGPEWKVKGAGDFDGDGRSDILWRHDNGQVSIWFMAGAVWAGDTSPGGPDPGGYWAIRGVGDLDNDGRSDILWQDPVGALALWFSGDINTAAQPAYQNVPGPVGLDWRVESVTDFNRDGRADILWRHANGYPVIWFMAGGRFLGESGLGPLDNGWQVKGVLHGPR